MGSLSFDQDRLPSAVPTTGENSLQLPSTISTPPTHLSTHLGADGNHAEPSISGQSPLGIRENDRTNVGQEAGTKGPTTVPTIAEEPVAVSTAEPVDGETALVALDDRDAPDARGDLPLPHAAGLIAEVLPFERASLEQAVDQFLDQLEGLGSGPLLEPGPVHLVPMSLTLMGVVTAAELARRQLRSRAGRKGTNGRQRPLGSGELLGFPELPGSWSTRLT
jgi:hypothetical protein